MPLDIVLIGPIGAGKSTVGKLLAQQLELPQCSMDEKRWAYYREIGYDEAIAQQKREAGGWDLQHYWKPFEAHAVDRILSECHRCVIDFGAGHSVYEDAHLFQRVERALAPYPNVVLLLPSADRDESIRILIERNRDLPSNTRDINRLFVTHPSNYRLAKFTVYTKGKTPEETCKEILENIKE
ncbi:MAG: shikimate kinase [Cyanobacteria bacterium P01_D01_bin.36]